MNELEIKEAYRLNSHYFYILNLIFPVNKSGLIASINN